MIKTSTQSIIRSLALGSALIIAPAIAFSQAPASLTTMGTPWTQDFDGLMTTGTTNSLFINGLVMTESGGGARDNEQYGGDNGGSTTGDTYSYGSTGSTERALGSLRSGTLIPMYGAWFTNNTGSTINELQIAYTGEQWRCGTAGRLDSLAFQYSTDATTLNDGTWTNVVALNFKSVNISGTGALIGNANTSAIASTITGLSIPDGASFLIRWVDMDASGADDGLAIDNLSLTPQATVVTPALSINDVSVNEGNAGTTSFDFTVSLSAPAGAGGVTFDIATADGTALLSDADYITNSLTGQTIAAGNTSYTFSVLVNGDVNLETDETFFVNVTNVTGATVSDGQGTGTIMNEDYIAPLVTGQPSDATVCAGDLATFSAQATGDPAPTVQWQVSTDGGANWSDVSGETSTTYSFTTAVADSGNMYWAIFTNPGGVDTTNAVTLTVNPTYSISESFTICSGSDYTFPDGSTTSNITATVVHLSSLSTILGCDSDIVTTINVNPVYNINETVSVCPGSSYNFPDGSQATNITSMLVHASNLSSVLGCDSIINTTVNVNPVDTTNMNGTICMGDTIDFFGADVTAAGTYYHTLTNMFGCDSVIELNITVNTLPVVTFDYLNDAMLTHVCVDLGGDTILFTEGSPVGGMYSGPFVSGDTLFSSALYFDSGEATYYFNYTYTDGVTGCSNTATDSLSLENCIGIKENTVSGMNISLFPNPAQDKVTLVFAGSVKTAEIRVINALGQQVLTQTAAHVAEINLDLSSVEKGVYFIEINANNERSVKRLIIE